MVEDWPAEKKNEHGGSTGNEADENSGKRRVQTFAIFQLGSEKVRNTAFSLSPSSLTLGTNAAPVHCGPCPYATEAFTFFQLKGGRLWLRAGCSQLRKPIFTTKWGQRSLIYTHLCLKGEKWPSQCRPRLFYSQPRQLPCARPPVLKPSHLPHHTFLLVQNLWM